MQTLFGSGFQQSNVKKKFLRQLKEIYPELDIKQHQENMVNFVRYDTDIVVMFLLKVLDC